MLVRFAKYKYPIYSKKLNENKTSILTPYWSIMQKICRKILDNHYGVRK